ncbi:MAG: 1-acyl-sn-glycerol-3-phosphate acyltransferase [Acidobacteriota bacterium]|nr:1-acyl-sn-glycerol-3-phosphate acyltransferase [Acidobacteriota bacterium]
MFNSVTLPLWAAALLVLIAAWFVLERLLVPSVRWVLRRRVNRVLDEVNKRLQIHVQPFKLTKRRVLLDRLIYDPEVLAAAEAFCESEEMPREVVMEKVKRYAHEIVPSFNAYLYFRFGYWLSRNLARALYRVRLGYADQKALEEVQPDSTIVFVMNHRSNMDYVLVSYLVAERTALSYAVGEWARIFPLESLVRSMGAYFVRRKSRNDLYRRVLARYVAMATAEGVTQAVYPEGGLSRDGSLKEPRLGLLDYMLRSFDPEAARDLVFVPVGLNYDRVLEDRTLLLDLDPDAPRKRGLGALATTLGFWLKNFSLWVSGKWYRFGYACVGFGAPVSMRRYVAEHGLSLSRLERSERFAAVEKLAVELMARVGEIIPVVPVSLVATVISASPERSWSLLELKAAVQELVERLESRGAHVYIPRSDADYAIEVGLRMLVLRRAVREEDGLLSPEPADLDLLRYYARSIGHLVDEASPVQAGAVTS